MRSSAPGQFRGERHLCHQPFTVQPGSILRRSRVANELYGLRAAALPRNIGPFDVRPDDLRPPEVVSHRIGNRLKRAGDLLRRVRGGRWSHRRRAACNVKSRDLRQRFDGAIHRIMTQRAMNVHIDETGGHEAVARIDDLRVLRPKHLHSRCDFLDPAAVDNDAMMLQHAVRADNATVNDHHHDARSMARPACPDKSECSGGGRSYLRKARTSHLLEVNRIVTAPLSSLRRRTILRCASRSRRLGSG